MKIIKRDTHNDAGEFKMSGWLRRLLSFPGWIYLLLLPLLILSGWKALHLVNGPLDSRQQAIMIHLLVVIVTLILTLGGLVTSLVIQHSRLRTEKESIRREQQYTQQLAKTLGELEQAHETAEQANRGKEEFLARMSHEIRNPISSILGLTQLLLTAELHPEERKYAQAIRYSCDSLLGLVNDILDFSKIDSGKLRLEKTPFDLVLALAELAEILAPKARQKGLEFIVKIGAEVPVTVLGDPVRLRQILLNLGDNAIKFTAKGIVRIEVDTTDPDPKQPRIRFRICDTGIGIAGDRREQLFQPFIQGDSATTRIYGGTGLGLSISKRLVELMAGEIGVESQPGQGSIFWFTIRFERPDPDLPVPAPPTPEKAIPFAAPTVIPSGLSDSPPLRILLVDDNPINQLVSQEILKRNGYDVLTATGGHIAIDLLQHHPVSVVLLDCQMPDLDGFRVAELIRSGAAGPNNALVPIIAITAMAMSGDREKCVQAGMNDYLAKPFTPHDLITVVARWTGISHPAASAALPAGSSLTFDLQVFLARLQGNEKVGHEIAALFLQKTPQHLAQLQEAFDHDETVAAGKKAHALKGTAGQMAGRLMFERAAAIEALCHSGDLAAARTQLPLLQESYQAMADAITGWLGDSRFS
jgi:signal transduction histidine kinase/response regulator of citrate/malate metabolism